MIVHVPRTRYEKSSTARAGRSHHEMSRASPAPAVKRMRPILGTFVSIRAEAVSPEAISAAEFAVESAFAAVARVQRLMSAHDESSDVSRINRAAPGQTVAVDAWTTQVLRRAQDISAATQGLFDCCVATRLQCEGHLPRFAGPKPDPRARIDDLHLRDGAVRIGRSLRVTLDGIAKGFAVDRAVEALERAGIVCGSVNAGGDLRVFGTAPQTIYLRDPENPARSVPIGALRSGAVATSALYFVRNAAEARRASRIVDPRTRRACRTSSSATVFASDCMTADALTKPLLIAPSVALPAIGRLGAMALVWSKEPVAT